MNIYKNIFNRKNILNHDIQLFNDETIINHGTARELFSREKIDITNVVYEISGVCNAKCPYCSSGSGKFHDIPTRFIPPKEFDIGIKKLFELPILKKAVALDLYNWGEPLLHPEFNKILSVLNRYDQPFNLSSNGSKSPSVSEKEIENIGSFRFSLSGFSQNSYNKVHKLPFRKILENIDKWVEILPDNTVNISFFLYKFNYSEVFEACNYFMKKGISFKVMSPYLTDFYQSIQYLLDGMDEIEEKKINEEIFLEYVKPFVKNKPKSWLCPLWKNQMAIDEYSNVITCCSISKKSAYYKIGKLCDISYEEFIQQRITSPICPGCNSIGNIYWFIHANDWIPHYLYEIDKKLGYK